MGSGLILAVCVVLVGNRHGGGITWDWVVGWFVCRVAGRDVECGSGQSDDDVWCWLWQVSRLGR
jgi:hypothetical protein